MATYDIGDDVFLRGTFRDTDAALADPTTVACRVLQPDRTIMVLSASKTSTGLYAATFQPTQHGQHAYRFEGTGSLRTAGESFFNVREQRVA